jgi:hypothetical protein
LQLIFLFLVRQALFVLIIVVITLVVLSFFVVAL